MTKITPEELPKGKAIWYHPWVGSKTRWAAFVVSSPQKNDMGVITVSIEVISPEYKELNRGRTIQPHAILTCLELRT